MVRREMTLKDSNVPISVLPMPLSHPARPVSNVCIPISQMDLGSLTRSSNFVYLYDFRYPEDQGKLYHIMQDIYPVEDLTLERLEGINKKYGLDERAKYSYFLTQGTNYKSVKNKQ